ncbi:MAG: response regulator transcription factor, partial [Patescibacteria group bacterium]
MGDFRIVLADDHRIFREGLKHLLSEGPELKVVGEAKTGKELLAILKTTECDLVISDIIMPVMDGLTALKEIRHTYPRIRVLMISMLSDFAHFEQAKALGASGYLSKDDASDDLLSAIEKVRAGKMYVSPSITTLLGERQIQ